MNDLDDVYVLGSWANMFRLNPIAPKWADTMFAAAL